MFYVIENIGTFMTLHMQHNYHNTNITELYVIGWPILLLKQCISFQIRVIFRYHSIIYPQRFNNMLNQSIMTHINQYRFVITTQCIT